MKQTFLDRVRESLTAAMADYNREDVTAQRLVIFPDKTGEWEPIIARLRGTLPIVTFGEYNPSTLTGPAVYIRSLVFRTIDSSLPEGQTPIIYLPGCSREQLRNLEECPDEIKPLAGLQYLGEVWSQRNGRDWTLLAYLKTSQGGLSLKVNDEPETREAIKNAANVLAVNSEKRNLEFVAWNEYVDRHFKDLHFGISKVPPKLKFGNSALQYWAEKWSSRFGEWIYDELFGYVWKPAADQFANSARPFFYAEHVRINGQLFLVPQESWGWAPAHMGTWVWLDRGWTWIPGDWFHSGVVEFLGISTFPTMDYYFLMGYGYELFRHKGHSSWLLDYLRRYYQEAWEQMLESWKHKAELDPDLNILPDKLAGIIKRVNKGPAADVAKRLGLDHNLSVLGKDKLTPERGVKLPNVIPDAAVKSRPVRDLGARNEIKQTGVKKALRDWNPDSRWAAGRGYTIQYSSSRNAVLCPELNISSDREHVLNRIGADRIVLPGQVSIPENSPQPNTNNTGGDNGVTPVSTRDIQVEKKDNSGK